MLIRALVAAVLAGVFTASHAHAADGEWTVIPSACVPSPSSTAYVWQGPAVYLPAAATVVLRCNVTDPADFMNFMDPVWNTIEVTYSDSDGMMNDSRVLVQLVRVGKATGVGVLAGTFDSNFFAGGAGTLLNAAGFFQMFDFTNFGYFLHITLTRTAAGGDTRIHRVRLY